MKNSLELDKGYLDLEFDFDKGYLGLLKFWCALPEIKCIFLSPNINSAYLYTDGKGLLSLSQKRLVYLGNWNPSDYHYNLSSKSWDISLINQADNLTINYGSHCPTALNIEKEILKLERRK